MELSSNQALHPPFKKNSPGRSPRCYFRQNWWSQAYSHWRGNPLLGPLVAARYPVRCPYQAPQHLDYDWIQGYADGHLDPPCPPPPRSQELVSDLPGTRHGLRRACVALDRKRGVEVDCRPVWCWWAHYPAWACLFQDPWGPCQACSWVPHRAWGCFHCKTFFISFGVFVLIGRMSVCGGNWHTGTNSFFFVYVFTVIRPLWPSVATSPTLSSRSRLPSRKLVRYLDIFFSRIWESMKEHEQKNWRNVHGGQVHSSFFALHFSV